MRPEVKHAIARALDDAIVDARPVSGGDINAAHACALASGRRVFVKSNADCDPDMFPCEARGLAWLGEAGAIRVPEVLAVNGPDEATSFLVLELIEPARPATGYDVALGHGLAALHRAGAATHGLAYPNFLATLPQDNTPEHDWAVFYGQRRLAPLVARAVERGIAPGSWASRFERLCARLPDLVGPAEPPSRLHGDLWSGNLHTDAAGAPVLIDPAVYGGHREIDLAMLRLFGAPSARFFDAYHEAYALAPGHEDRVSLYQLYPLLAHVNLFGRGYVGSVESALARYE